MSEPAQVIIFPGVKIRRDDRPYRIGKAAEEAYRCIDDLKREKAYKLIREIGDYCNGFGERK